MNAGATAPEWASGIKIGTFTRALNTASGDVAYTGVGFKPSAIILIVGTPDAATGYGSIGIDDGTSHYCQFNNSVASLGTFGLATSFSVYIINTGTVTGLVKTMDADGFTITWALTGNAGTSTVRGAYIALR